MVLSTPSQPIPPGKYLMLGDNRNNSSDGHHWGLLDAERVVGRGAICVLAAESHWSRESK
jgi:hypothetical protein